MKISAGSNGGQTLFEVIVALGIAVMVVTALVKVTTISIGNATFSRNQSGATKYAQEAMEKIRAYKVEHAWDDFANSCANLNPTPTPPLQFTRTISCETLTDPYNNAFVDVTVIVSWSDSKGVHESNLRTSFYQY